MLLCRYSVQFSYLQLTCYTGLKWSLLYEIFQYPLPYLPFLCICIQVNQHIPVGIRPLWLWNWIFSFLMTLQISLSLYWLLCLPWVIIKVCPHKPGNEGSKCWLNASFSYHYSENAVFLCSIGLQHCFSEWHFYLIFCLQLFLWNSRSQTWTNRCNQFLHFPTLVNIEETLFLGEWLS